MKKGLRRTLAIILALSSMPADAIAEEADLDVSEPALEETVTLDEEADAEGGEAPANEQPIETEELDPDEVFSLEDETSEEVEITLDEDELELDEAEVFKEEADTIDSAKTTAKTSHVLYRVHRQTYGWEKDWKQDGARSGTTGQSKRLEAIYIKLQDKPFTGSIRYRTHVQKVGWQGWKKEGQLSGTTGRALRLEAIQIKLTGQMAKEYDVWYRVHAQRFGWMGWAKNGALQALPDLHSASKLSKSGLSLRARKHLRHPDRICQRVLLGTKRSTTTRLATGRAGRAFVATGLHRAPKADVAWTLFAHR